MDFRKPYCIACIFLLLITGTGCEPARRAPVTPAYISSEDTTLLSRGDAGQKLMLVVTGSPIPSENEYSDKLLSELLNRGELSQFDFAIQNYSEAGDDTSKLDRFIENLPDSYQDIVIVSIGQTATLAFRHLINGRHTIRRYIIIDTFKAQQGKSHAQIVSSLNDKWQEFILQHRVAPANVTYIKGPLSNSFLIPELPSKNLNSSKIIEIIIEAALWKTVYHDIPRLLPADFESHIPKNVIVKSQGKPRPSEELVNMQHTDPLLYGTTLYLTAERLIRDSNPAEAVAIIEEYLIPYLGRDTFPYLYADTLTALGRAIMESGLEDSVMAQSAFDEAMQIWELLPKKADFILLEKARAYVSTKEYSRAIDLLEKVQQNRPYNRQTILMESDIHFLLPDKKSHEKGISLLETALKLIDKGNDPHLYGDINIKLAEKQTSQGEFKKAQNSLEKALEVFTKDSYTSQYGIIHYKLGKLTIPDTSEDEDYIHLSQKALHHFREALFFLPPDKAHKEKLESLKALGDISLNRARIQHNGFPEAARYYEEAKKIISGENHSEPYRKIQLGLALSYVHIMADSAGKTRQDYMKNAISIFKQALAKTNHDIDRAYIKMETAQAYLNLSRGNKDDIKKAITNLEDALKNTDKSKNKPLYAKIKMLLAKSYGLSGDKKNTEKAKKIFTGVVSIYSADKNRYDYSLARLEEGLFYISNADREEFLLKGISDIKAALDFFDVKKHAYEYALCQYGLGLAFSSITEGDKEVNQGYSIDAFSNALSIFKKKLYPYEYARTSKELGITYLKLGRKQKTIKKAIYNLTESLHFYSLSTTPNDYARIQNTLGSAYSEVRDGGRQDRQKALNAYAEALKVWTSEKTPLEFASTKNNIGSLLLNMESNNETLNLIKAIKAFDEALETLPENQPLILGIIKNNKKKAQQKLSLITDDQQDKPGS